ncbi:hypothetical protein [Natrinema versiforme]|uniref:Uncharacterized protein n=1 Tax=Natrinema versiforme TaxID=88724 RepID=A0A4V1FY41_9EURY|nr:hypothetical protein [Natrinema versiforme]QCS41192.1 hypothetical protein FEJ81_02080 [Natrinema versiforme]
MAGIIDTIKLAGTLVFALPAAMAGIGLLNGDRPLFGGALIGLAIGLVVIQHWLTMPTDIPEVLAQRVVGTVTKEPDAEPEPDDER